MNQNAAILLLVFAAVSVCISAPVMAKAPSAEDAKNFRSCMSEDTSKALRSERCRSVMRKMHITKSDYIKMKSCEAQTTSDNSDCQEMAEKHPELTRGHGMDDGGSNNP